jgi:hypothetical protein
MRELTSHKVNGLNEKLDIHAFDEPGNGNACHRYRITVNCDLPGNVPYYDYIKFQKGAIQESGVNGISNEALLAIVEDRLAGFQSGPFACFENEKALCSVRNAMFELQQRTRERTERGVEGTMNP